MIIISFSRKKRSEIRNSYLLCVCSHYQGNISAGTKRMKEVRELRVKIIGMPIIIAVVVNVVIVAVGKNSERETSLK